MHLKGETSRIPQGIGWVVREKGMGGVGLMISSRFCPKQMERCDFHQPGQGNPREGLGSKIWRSDLDMLISRC